jgi:hypothetical protein
MDAWLRMIEDKEKNPKRVSFLAMITRLNGIFGTKVTPLAYKDSELATSFLVALIIARIAMPY